MNLKDFGINLPILAQAPSPWRSPCGWTLVASGLFLWPKRMPRPRGGERGSPKVRPDTSGPDSSGAEPQGGCRAREWVDIKGKHRPGAEAVPAGRLLDQAEGAGDRSGAAATSMARWLCQEVRTELWTDYVRTRLSWPCFYDSNSLYTLDFTSQVWATSRCDISHDSWDLSLCVPSTPTSVRRPEQLLLPDTVFFASDEKPSPGQSDDTEEKEKVEKDEERRRHSRQRSNSDSFLKMTNPDDIRRGHEQLCIRRAEAVKQRGISLLNEVDAQYSALQVLYSKPISSNLCTRTIFCSMVFF